MNQLELFCCFYFLFENTSNQWIRKSRENKKNISKNEQKTSKNEQKKRIKIPTKIQREKKEFGEKIPILYKAYKIA